jgi:basic membrane protein A
MHPIKVGVVTDVGQPRTSRSTSLERGRQGRRRRERWLARRDRHPEHLGLRREHPDICRPGFDVIVTVGFLLGTDTAAAAKANPDIHFVGVDQAICVDEQGVADPTFACKGDAATLLPNYQGIVFAEAQPGYLAGIVAASISESGKIGAIGGTNVPAVVNYWRGYENGAKSVNRTSRSCTRRPTRIRPRASTTRPRAAPLPSSSSARRRRDLPARRPHGPGRPRGRLRRRCPRHRRWTSTRL